MMFKRNSDEVWLASQRSLQAGTMSRRGRPSSIVHVRVGLGARAGLSKFVIADITNPQSSPLELEATVPEIMVPFRPIIEEGEKPFAMMPDLWSKHRDWVFEPLYYSSVDALVASLDEKIIRPAEARFVELLKRKADTMGGKHI